MKIIITENQLSRLLEQEQDVIDFKDFSEPILIPQYGIYLVKFLGTSKFEKDPESERIVFRRDSDGKEFTFNSEVVQKTNKSDFYINLDDLRKKYHVDFESDFEIFIPNISSEEEQKIITHSTNLYMDQRGNEKCKNSKCSQYKDILNKIIKDFYGSNIGLYEPYGCKSTEGYVNIYSFNNTEDSHDNTWSKLNYLSDNRKVLQALIEEYVNQRKTFTHEDFMKWLKDNKEKYFKGIYMDKLLSIVQSSNPLVSLDLNGFFKKLYPELKVINNFCPSSLYSKEKVFLVNKDGKPTKIQYISLTKLVKQDNGWIGKISQNQGPSSLIGEADYIATNKGMMFPNNQIKIDKDQWFFPEPEE